jgi:hypothetical protein
LDENLWRRSENGGGASGEIDRTSGAIETVELDGPERARLSE